MRCIWNVYMEGGEVTCEIEVTQHLFNSIEPSPSLSTCPQPTSAGKPACSIYQSALIPYYPQVDPLYSSSQVLFCLTLPPSLASVRNHDLPYCHTYRCSRRIGRLRYPHRIRTPPFALTIFSLTEKLENRMQGTQWWPPGTESPLFLPLSHLQPY
jgi:hypothetical protein